MSEKRDFPDLVVPEEWGPLGRKRLHDWCRRVQDQLRLVDESLVSNETDISNQSIAITNIANSISGVTRGGAGRVIWEWNARDISQFGPSVTYSFAGAANAGSIALTVASLRQRNVLRTTFTNWTGGILVPLVGVTLPDRFALDFTIADYATGPDAFGCANYSNVGGVIDGLLNYQLFGGAGHNLYFAVADTASATTVAFSSSATLVASDMNDGGMPLRVEYHRQRYSTQVWQVRVTEDSATSSGIVRGSSRASTSAGLPALGGWDGLNFNTVGLAFYETGGAVNGTVDLRDLRIVDLT